MVRIPLQITMLPSQHSLLSHRPHANETPFKWRFAGGPMMARLKWIFGASLPLSTENKQTKRCQSWPSSDKTFWIRVWCRLLIRKPLKKLFTQIRFDRILMVFPFFFLSKRSIFKKTAGDKKTCKITRYAKS